MASTAAPASRHLALLRMPRLHAVPSTAAAARPRAAAPVGAIAAALVAALAPAASAQTAQTAQTAPLVHNPPGSVAERSPNLFTNWVIDPGTVQFNFLHRFTESGAPAHQI